VRVVIQLLSAVLAKHIRALPFLGWKATALCFPLPLTGCP